MDLSTKKRIAASVLKVGKNRLKLDPEASEEILDAITRESIKELFAKGVIQIKPKKGVSRGRVKKITANIKKRGRGPGSKKGAKGARRGKKTIWVTKVRSLRSRIKVMRDRGEITGKIFDDLYRQIKGGQIRSIRHMETIIKQHRR
ncbi:MAG TPA: 50S ribosomal protein L19e [Nitrososphaerales archaeon]